MTLSRQLTLLIAALVALLFLGTFSISVLNTRAYLEQQLASHAQDAATSLGLSATSHFASDDRALVTSMVNAMFHRGDYLMIRLETLQGEAWIERTTDRLTDTVPGWFVHAFALSPPERSATMMSGWRQMGRVRVVSHPGLAYEKLWQTTRQTLSLFLLVALLVLLSALFGLRLLLRPIKAIEAQAEAICNREYVTSDRPPFTLEFRRVVEAMDRLSEKVGRMLGEAEGVATRLRAPLAATERTPTTTSSRHTPGSRASLRPERVSRIVHSPMLIVWVQSGSVVSRQTNSTVETPGGSWNTSSVS